MPQGSRKVPFSAKQKKIQLQQKRERKKLEHEGGGASKPQPAAQVAAVQEEKRSLGEVIRINAEGDLGQRSSRVFRYCLQFRRETPQELEKRKRRAREPYTPLDEVVHFPPALYIHVTQELGKRLVLILNKVDLVPDTLTAAWITFFRERYPGLIVLPFASYAGMTAKGKRGKRQGKLRMASEACRGLLDACKDMVGDQVDLTSWRNKIEEELAEEAGDDDDEEEHDALASAPTELVAPDTSFYEEERFKGGRLTLGFVGQPNVGKSSLLNALVGRKVVSVSRTPGHTKHFQTIFLTDNVRLCDCPGLVFPSLQPKALQVLTGCFPIAQLREPYSAIQYIAERVDLPGILKLQPPDGAGDTHKPWSAFDLCEAWAVERGYLTAKAGRPDAYRAANSLLRMALDGRTLCLAFRPQGYSQSKGSEVDSALLAHLARIRGEPPVKSASSESEQEESEDESSEEDEEEEEEDHFQSNKFAALANDVL
ncbi:guanine nucleotide-binding protein-like 1 isoform X2 [Dermacentor andersoni]|uniref:guanine nucleotide-binding protein-like 1 isoform X2 n=1 Tax=Dermacentor andersoni TaxID=34620 RepID=UPI0024166B3E|nr:guanine nucleotide-binding protein-like 1 isoform X2 [Dermacentor andersoni]